ARTAPTRDERRGDGRRRDSSSPSPPTPRPRRWRRPRRVAGSAPRQPSALAGDAEAGVGQRTQPWLRNGLEAPLAIAVRLVGDALQRVVDLLDGDCRLSREGQVALPVDGDGATLAGLLVELHITRLALECQRVGLRAQRGGLLLVDGTLVREELFDLVEKFGVLGVGAGLRAYRRRLRLGREGGARRDTVARDPRH